MALLSFDLTDVQKNRLREFIKGLKKELSRTLIPAFWPPRQSEDPDWPHIKGNYAFDFKNKPYHFHNGGIWPVWMGWFCLGLAKNEMKQNAGEIIADFVELASTDNWNFQEYLSSDQFQLLGKHQMGFTASGIVYMYHALKDKGFKTKLGL